SWRCSPQWNRHPEPNGSRRATPPTSEFQQRPGHSQAQCLKQIFIEYAKRRSNSRIYRPIEKICESYQNPKTTKILDLISLFDADFETELRRQWNEELEVERQHIDNMVDDRITIAHRKRVHVNVSSSKLEDYFKAYSGLLDRVYIHFLGP
ncbi:hypothetical protein VSX64_04700, partial [Aurantimonas sp. C2-6-R+9]|uniref:hypothetical protein n=1 Tax=Aurantimonas sp. C2-6-R+9 TaxID=3114365 RepID=UPI002E194524|nr:hypothetical protein [Aurantimonas sp. C2-6-R+9]